MDLFSDFSFESATSNRRCTQYNTFDMEDVSPSSSRSASPSAATLVEPLHGRRVSMAELADSFDRQHLHHHTPSPLFDRIQNPSARRTTSLPTENYDNVRRRRQSGARNLCSASRLASIETLVDRMMKDGSSCYASLHPSGRHSRRTDITSAPTSMPQSPSMGSETTNSDDDEDSDLEAMEEPKLTRTRTGGGAASAKKRSGIEKIRRKVTQARR
jgi:hypothetical protein